MRAVKATNKPIDYVCDELPMDQGYAFIAWHAENDPFSSVERISDGYIVQESQRLRSAQDHKE